MGTDRVGNPIIGITISAEGDNLRLKHNYASVIIRAGGVPVLLPSGADPHSVSGIIDGLLIPGGDDLDPCYYSEVPHSSARLVPRERSDYEISLLKTVMVLRKPVFGICYGMQLINVALGGSLYQDVKSQIHGAIDHSTGEHIVKITKESGVGEYMPADLNEYPDCTVNSSHHQAVRERGRGIRVFASSPDGIAEGVYMEGYPFLAAVQWHPERSEDDLSKYLLRSFVRSAYAG